MPSKSRLPRRWLVRPTKSSSREYATLRDEDATNLLQKSNHHIQPKRKVTVADATLSVHPSRSRTTESAEKPQQPHVPQHEANFNDTVEFAILDAVQPENDTSFVGKESSLLDWNTFRLPNLDGQVADDEEDKDDTDENMLYMANYYGRTTFPNNKSIDLFDKHSNSRAATRIPPTRRLRVPVQKRKTKRLDIDEQKMEHSSSFETQETQLEEASETSVSTTETDDSALAAKYATRVKKVRWVDQVQTKSQELATIHLVKYDIEATCRVVILLLMDHGPQSLANNFEFLHCEFRHDDRLRVSDALAQVTEIVLGTPDAPKLPPACAASKTKQPFRPFTRLCFDGKELINMFALQDYFLEDGQSILVALRDGSNDRDMLLKQSALLLADKRLRRGIRKARIAGRSLQTLYGVDGLREQEKSTLEAETRCNDGDASTMDDSTCDDTDDEEARDEKHPWSAFDNLSLTSFDDDEFGDASFDTNTSSLSSNWLDDDFFDNREFFQENSSTKSSAKSKLQQPFTALNPNGLGWASFEFDSDDDDENLFSTVDVSFEVDVCGIDPSGQSSETLTFHGVRNRRARTTAVNV